MTRLEYSKVVGQRSQKCIAYFKNWWTNIGNAFIDIGALYLLERVGGFKIYALSGTLIELVYVQRMLRKATRVKRAVPFHLRRSIPAPVRSILKRAFHVKSYRTVAPSVRHISFNVISRAEVDYAVFSFQFFLSYNLKKLFRRFLLRSGFLSILS